MKPGGRTAPVVSAAATLFVLGTAIWTRNSGLYVLAGLAAAATMGLLARKGSA